MADVAAQDDGVLFKKTIFGIDLEYTKTDAAIDGALVAGGAMFAGVGAAPAAGIAAVRSGAMMLGRGILRSVFKTAAKEGTEAVAKTAAKATAEAGVKAAAKEGTIDWVAPTLSKEAAEFAAKKAAERTTREATEAAAKTAAKEGVEAATGAAAGVAAKTVTKEAVEATSRSLGSMALDAGKWTAKAALGFALRPVKFVVGGATLLGAGAVGNHAYRAFNGDAGDTLLESGGRSLSQLTTWGVSRVGSLVLMFGDEMRQVASGYVKDQLGVEPGETTGDAIERKLVEKSNLTQDQAKAVADFVRGKKTSDYEGNPKEKGHLIDGLKTMIGLDNGMAARAEQLEKRLAELEVEKKDSMPDRVRAAGSAAVDGAGELLDGADGLLDDHLPEGMKGIYTTAKGLAKDNPYFAMGMTLGAAYGAMGAGKSKIERTMGAAMYGALFGFAFQILGQLYPGLMPGLMKMAGAAPDALAKIPDAIGLDTSSLKGNFAGAAEGRTAAPTSAPVQDQARTPVASQFSQAGSGIPAPAPAPTPAPEDVDLRHNRPEAANNPAYRLTVGVPA